jgi:hypothetical protein
MANLGRWLGPGIALPDVLWRTVGVAWALVMAWLLVLGERDHRYEFTSRFECGTDPLDILRVGETVEQGTLRFIVDAHCANARYLSDERIELRYGGAPVDVETSKLEIAGETYYKIVSVGGWAAE